MAKPPKLNLAQAMEDDLKVHDPMATQLYGPLTGARRAYEFTQPESMGAKAYETTVPRDHDHTVSIDQETLRDNDQVPLSTKSLETMIPKTSETLRPSDLGEQGSRNYPLARTRIGMRRIAGHFSPRVVQQMRVLAASQDCTIEDLVGRALNMLFAAEGLPTIAFDKKEKGRGPQ